MKFSKTVNVKEFFFKIKLNSFPVFLVSKGMEWYVNYKYIFPLLKRAGRANVGGALNIPEDLQNSKEA